MIDPERRRGIRLAALSWLIASTIQGCGPEESGPAVYPTSGSVFVDGRPAAGVELTFHPVKPSPGQDTPTIAVTGPDGGFRPSTRLANDGAPDGDYSVTAVWRKVTIVEGEEIQGNDLLGGKYSNPGTSTLQATIRRGDNTLPPIDLTSTARSTSSSRRTRP